MSLTLADTTPAAGNSESMTASLLGHADALARPDTMLELLGQLSLVWAGVLVALGLFCLLRGYKLYKAVVIAAALAVGLAVGWQLGRHIQSEVIVAVCLGVLLAVVAWPLMKYAVALCGGLAGALLGANAWTALAGHLEANGSVAVDPGLTWVGALIGLVALGLLSFVVFKLAVLIFTSLSGSALAVLGVVALLLQVPAWNPTIVDSLRANPMILPMLVIVPAVIGLIIQQQLGALRTDEPVAEA